MLSFANPQTRAACILLAISLTSPWCGCVDLPSPVIPLRIEPDRPALYPMDEVTGDADVDATAAWPLWFNNSAPLIVNDAGMIAVPQRIDPLILQVPQIVDPIAIRVLVPSP